MPLPCDSVTARPSSEIVQEVTGTRGDSVCMLEEEYITNKRYKYLYNLCIIAEGYLLL